MGSKYYDSSAVIQVIGCSLKKPSLLDSDGQYFYNEDDFMSDFHKVVFGAINNLHSMGANNISIKDIENYLSTRENSRQIYAASKGSEWLVNTIKEADLANFDYYYSRMKKMTLLRSYEACGMDMSFIYDPDEIFDDAKKKRQGDYLDNLSLNEIADIIDNRIFDVRAQCVDNASDEIVLAGDGIFNLLESLESSPDMGVPLYDNKTNAVTRGARLGKFYIRSAPTGVGILCIIYICRL